MTCAGNNTIAALLAGGTDPALEAHLDGCSSCRQLVADLGRGLSAVGTPHQTAAASEALPRAGDTIGRYEIRRVLGVGGMGVVYEAHDTTLDRRVALKLLRPDLVDHDRAQLIAEAQAMAKLSHPNIAVVHDAGIERGQCYVCMEYIAGQTLRDWLVERPRSRREVLDVAIAAARGLAYVHEQRLVHLDFKPDNVMIARTGRVVVTDFGLARVIGARQKGPRVAVGTPAYMAPEQRRGEVTDARTDQFGFCATVVEALGGTRGEASISVAAPGDIRRALARGLSPAPADRFDSLDELIRTLGRPRRTLARLAMVAAAALVVAVPLLATQTGRDVVVRTVDRFVDRVRVAPALPSEPVPAAADAVPDHVGQAAARTDTATPLARARALSIVATLHALADDRVRAAHLHGAGASHLETSDMSSVDSYGCSDGSDLVCMLPEPECPPTTAAAIQNGCWICADAQTCMSRGVPRDCADGSPLQCKLAKPVCSGETVAVIRGGCWHCDDPFACLHGNIVPPPHHKDPDPPPHHDTHTCGDGRCDFDESSTSCPTDCTVQHCGSGAGSAGGGGGSGGGCTSCGNSMCEIGEDHASCPSDCCELRPDGACAPTCGNGFCESGESHASCAQDCCETLPSGACAPVCGNGFCESGETPGTCPGDCV